MKRPTVGVCAVMGGLLGLVPIAVGDFDGKGWDVIAYGAAVLALIGAVLGAFVGLLLDHRR